MLDTLAELIRNVAECGQGALEHTWECQAIIMMFQTRVLLGGMSMYDRYQDWRLDVDNMTYEELLELGDKIGYVNTGLREDEIVRNLRKVKHPAFDSSFRYSTEMEKKCSICQEEFEANEEMGRLDCGHSYHVYCIKQWLSQKNVCPVCKTAVTKT
uniref:RING-type E3 ubiquitin transferase n=1 Tax=Oryza glumipatula TaxID=40148 RepID=A0A0D9YDH7_9ORYZ